MIQLVCPTCLRTVEVVSVNASASCTHGRNKSRFNQPVTMIPIENLTKENA